MLTIINHIDTLIAITKILIKAMKVLAKCAHFALLFVGGAVILTCFWAVTCYRHVTGKTQTYVDLEEAEHGAVPAEYGEPMTVSPEEFLPKISAVVNVNWEKAMAVGDMTLTELREVAKGLKIPNYSRKKRATLERELTAAA